MRSGRDIGVLSEVLLCAFRSTLQKPSMRYAMAESDRNTDRASRRIIVKDEHFHVTEHWECVIVVSCCLFCPSVHGTERVSRTCETYASCGDILLKHEGIKLRNIDVWQDTHH